MSYEALAAYSDLAILVLLIVWFVFDRMNWYWRKGK
jgi:hypothetical protein